MIFPKEPACLVSKFQRRISQYLTYHHKFFGLFVLVLCGLAVFQVDAGVLFEVKPTGASAAYAIQISGSGFNSTASKNEVTFTPSSGSPVKVLATAIGTSQWGSSYYRITVTVPAVAVGTTALSVRNTATNEVSGNRSMQVIKLTLPEKTSGTQGQANIGVRITGSSNTKFSSGSTTVNFGQGITVNSVTVQSATSLIANITIAATATLGTRQVTVVSSSQGAIIPNAFSVTGVQSALSVSAQATPTSGTAPLNVSFTGSASGGRSPYSYSWNFGDGTAKATIASPAHQYTNAGSYTAALTVTDADQRTQTKSIGITVTAAQSALTVSASATPSSGVAPLNVSFKSSVSGGSNSYTYDWNFGDGSAHSTLANPSHTYNSSGNYTAILTVRDGVTSKTSSVGITVSSAPTSGSLSAEKLTVTNPRYGSGWASDHWIPSRQKILVWGGDSHNPNGNNSVQLFNPATRAYEIVQQNNGPAWDRGLMQFTDGVVALTNRDNHFSLYVPKRNEYWAFLGNPSSGVVNPDNKEQLTGHFGGIFNLTENRWTKIAYTRQEFAQNLIANFVELFFDPYNVAHTWNESLDTGVYFAWDKDETTAALFLLEPNAAGPEPYRLVKVVFSNLVAVSANRNSIIAVGEYVYVYGGLNRAGEYTNTLIRFHLPTRAAVVLASGPKGLYYPVVTYDSRRNKMVVFGGGLRNASGGLSGSNSLFIYDIATNTWQDRTGEISLPYMHNGSGAYSATTDEHIYRGGNYFDAAGNQLEWYFAYDMWSLKLDAP